MAKIKEGFKGERLVSMPEKLLEDYRKEPLVSPLHVRKIGYFPRVKYHYVQKKEGTDYAMLIYCTEGRGWYSFQGKTFSVQRNQYILIPPMCLMHLGQMKIILGQSIGSISREN